MRWIDLNCDMGEMPEAIADGTQNALMASISSVNVACGAHAGDEHTMTATILQALRRKLAVGAHPGYRDPANFGRLEWNLPPDILADSVFEQILALAEVASRCGAHLTHVKPHGALYNQAARQKEVARAVAAGVARWSHGVVLFGLAGSLGLDVYRAAGFTVAPEAFADRRYEADGTLRPRRHKDALIRDPEEAARQAVRIAEEGTAWTLCLHGDTPGAPRVASAVARALKDAGIVVRPFSRTETEGPRIL